MNCYVYRCINCGEEVFINKDNNQLQLFEHRCKCSYPKNEYMFIGEGKFETKEIRTFKYNDNKSDSYIRYKLGSKQRTNSHKFYGLKAEDINLLNEKE